MHNIVLIVLISNMWHACTHNIIATYVDVAPCILYVSCCISKLNELDPVAYPKMEILFDDRNSPNADNSSLGEFPYWRITLPITLVSSTLMSCCVIFLHVLLIVVFLKTKKEHFKPLNLVHISLLVSVILEEIFRVILDVLYLPSIHRHCVCPVLVGTIYALEVTFFTAQRPFTFASLGVLQFLLVVRKKKLVNVKSACGSIVFCTGIGLLFISLTARTFHQSDERIFCYENHCPGARPESDGLGDIITIFLALVVSSFIPSLVVLFITSTWSCAVFKHYYTGGDDQLNRRILSLPIVMPLALIASTLLEAAVALLSTEILLMLSLGDYLPYWIGFSQSLLNVLFRILSRSTYPVVLIYTHSHVREAAKKLLKQVSLKVTFVTQVTPLSDQVSYTS